MAHTSGPWQWLQRGGNLFLGTPDRGILVVMDFARCGMNGGQPRFSVWDGAERGRMGGVMRKAQELGLVGDHPDARLIAAAPELLQALSDLLKVIAVDELISESVSYMKQARQAVAQATGDTLPR